MDMFSEVSCEQPVSDKRLEELKDFFKKDKYATMSGCEILEVGKGYCRAVMHCNDMHRNGYGGIMGGAMFTLMDFAFAVASNEGGVKTVASSCSITYVGNTDDNELFAKAVCIKDGRSTCLYHVEILDSKGKKLAYAQCNGFHLG